MGAVREHIHTGEDGLRGKQPIDAIEERAGISMNVDVSCVFFSTEKSQTILSELRQSTVAAGIICIIFIRFYKNAQWDKVLRYRLGSYLQINAFVG